MTVHKVKYLLRTTLFLIMVFAIAAIQNGVAKADEYSFEVYYNEETGYGAYIDDAAQLIDYDSDYYYEITELMEKITSYGNVAVLTTDNNSGTTRDYAIAVRKSWFGEASATVFTIDMDNREIYILSYGKILKTISSDRAYLITDNTYSLCTDKKYTDCIYETLSQEVTLLEGGSISQPMKYICNAILAILIAIMVVYYNVSCGAGDDLVKVEELLADTKYSNNLKDLYKKHIKTERHRNSSSSSSGGSSGGGGGGGGGGHSF